jgi:RNA polymerase sigma-70 factor (ECF subfamily)
MFVMQGRPLGDPEEGLARLTDRDAITIEARLRSGDGSALMELFQREEKRAFALAYRVVGDAATAEDAVQEAFAQLWEQAGRLKPGGGRIESLLMTIVHRRAIDHVRKAGRIARSMPDPDLLDQIDERATAMLDQVEDALSTATLRAELRAALAALPAEQRAILEQAYFKRRSLKEIAEIECLPLGTVKSRLRLAMEKLTRAMGSGKER